MTETTTITAAEAAQDAQLWADVEAGRVKVTTRDGIELSNVRQDGVLFVFDGVQRIELTVEAYANIQLTVTALDPADYDPHSPAARNIQDVTELFRRGAYPITVQVGVTFWTIKDIGYDARHGEYHVHYRERTTEIVDGRKHYLVVVGE